MLKKVNSALLLTDVPAFAERVRALATDAGIDVTVEAEWNKNFRVHDEVVLMGTKYLEKLNESYLPEVVLILKEHESPFPFIKKGVTRFVLDYKDDRGILLSFFKAEPVVLHASSLKLSEIISNCNMQSYCHGDYDFRFDKNVYKYKDREIYLPESVKRFLAEWLLGGHKDNSKRSILFNLRQKLGKEFLADVDRFGNIKEEKNEF
jgi:hypothetical protein